MKISEQIIIVLGRNLLLSIQMANKSYINSPNIFCFHQEKSVISLRKDGFEKKLSRKWPFKHPLTKSISLLLHNT